MSNHLLSPPSSERLSPGYPFHMDAGVDILGMYQQRQFPGDDVCETILRTFTTCYEVITRPPFIAIVCKELPSKPWPVTIGGVPLFVTNQSSAPEVYNFGERAINGQRCKTEGEIRYGTALQESTVSEIFRLFQEMNISIRGLQWLYFILTVFVDTTKPDEPSWRQNYPALINNVPVHYQFGRDDLSEHAQREMFFESSSCSTGIVSSFGDFANTAPLSRAFGDIVFMDTPSNGCVQGIHMGQKYFKPATHEPAGSVRSSVMDVIYFGNSLDDIFDGCSGATIRNQKYKVLARFRSMGQDPVPLAYCMSVDPSVQRSFEQSGVPV